MKPITASFLLLVFGASCSAASAGRIVATNAIPFEYEYSTYFTSIGYSSTTNGGFLNTAISQRFQPSQSGQLASIEVLFSARGSGAPLLVGIHEDLGGQPGRLIAEDAFAHAEFPFSYNDPGEQTKLDFSQMNVALTQDETYHAVFRTATANGTHSHFHGHIIRPSQGDLFGLPYLHSRDGGVTWNAGSRSGLEAPIQVSIVVPEPATGALLTWLPTVYLARRRSRWNRSWLSSAG